MSRSPLQPIANGDIYMDGRHDLGTFSNGTDRSASSSGGKLEAFVA